ncbi:discoidin domain-containing protein [Nonomuraea sp. NBC_01738]|uniref:discoidin domain-containing protein n=1 Tax=Nonomuraea sp. NBC_01738 TaxID=2976003 RepID=UPI002E13FB9F|nr:discoidin domain-containing protein [Nonomuraea sp. NBC_01738]
MRALTPPLAVAVALAGLLAATTTTASAADRGNKPSYRLECDGDGPGSTCTVVAKGKARPHRVEEFITTVRSGDQVWARDTVYSREGTVRSRPFVRPKQDITVDVSVTSLPENHVGTPLRLMSWNLFVGGTFDRKETTGENLVQMIEYMNEVNPDILFVVEAYGSAQKILDGLNAGRAEGDRFSAVMITQPEDNSHNGDNLWLYTKLKVEKVYPRYADADIDSFNFGGARLGLPNGKHVNAFSMWTWHDGWAYGDTHDAAVQNVHGLPRTKTDAQILEGDMLRRYAMGKAILEKAIPSFVGDDDAPILMGGDLNAQSHLDWSEQFADAPGHGGVVLDWPYTKLYTEAGFMDVFRYANPDAGRFPGRTWSPFHGMGAIPGRIDYTFARGKDVRILGSRADTRRLPQHQNNWMDDPYPFYSDHGSVVTDILIRGKGTGPDRTPVTEEVGKARDIWPTEPAGRRVPPAELKATASTFKPGIGDPSRAVDGNLTTDFHSDYPVVVPQPHFITVDLGKVRALSAVRYQPKLRTNMNGTILKGMVQVSDDGVTFRDVKAVEWARMTSPNDVSLDGISARYIRLRSDYSLGGASALAEIIPYEKA